MAVTKLGQYRLISAYGFRKQGSGRFILLRNETATTGAKSENAWIDWYLTGFTITANTLSLSDRVGGSIFIMSE